MMEDWQLQPASDLGMAAGERLRSVRRERGSLPWIVHLFLWSIVEVALRVYHRLSINGREHLPKQGSFILIANHSSHLDTLVLGCCINWKRRPDSFPIAAGDTFFKRRGAALLSALFVNALPMWRKSTVTHTLADLRARLATRQCIYIVFPEGTRTRDGQMTRFKSGLGMIVAGTSVPVIPCRVAGTFEALPPSRRFPKPFRLSVQAGWPLSFESVSNDRSGWDEVARRVEEAVRAL